MINFNTLPVMSDFSDLKYGDKIYSRRFGLGTVLSLYNNEVVAQFSDRRTRIALDEKDISLIPESSTKKNRRNANAIIRGEKVSFGKMKKMMRQEISDEWISISEAADVLGLRKKVLIENCEKNGIEITKFGIRKQDLFKSKQLLSNK